MAAGGREILLWRVKPQPPGKQNGDARPRAFSVADEKVRLAHLTPDGRTILTVSEGRGEIEPAAETNVRLWDARTGELQRTLLCGVQTAAAALSPSGKFLVTGDWGDGPSRLWDLSNENLSPKEVRSFAGLHRVMAVAFAPGGKSCAAVTRDGDVCAYDVAGGSARWKKAAHAGAARCVAYSHDGKLLATAGDDKAVQIRDARTGDIKHTLKGHADRVNAVAFSPDGRLLASGGQDETARLWDVATGRPRGTVRPNGQSVPSVAFSPDGRTLATGGSRRVGVATVILWDVDSAKPRQQFDARNGPAFSVAFARDGELLMAAGGCEVLLWPVSEQRVVPGERGP
jgi:WD40 repeat protein